MNVEASILARIPSKAKIVLGGNPLKVAVREKVTEKARGRFLCILPV